MHKLTATIVIVIIFIAIGIVIFSSRSDQNNTQELSNLSQLEGNSSSAVGVEDATQAAEEEEEVATPAARYTHATVETSKGVIEMQLFPDDAPNTVANFGEKAKSGFYDNLTFHRVEDWVVQGGDPLGNGTGGGDMKTELNEKPFVVGSVGVARGGNIQISNDAQFFITKQDAEWLNGQYTNFGLVTSGMDVVNSLEMGDTILSISVE